MPKGERTMNQEYKVIELFDGAFSVDAGDTITMELAGGELLRILEITKVVDRYSKLLYESQEQNQSTDELQGMITILLNELLELLNIDEKLEFVEYLPVGGV